MGDDRPGDAEDARIALQMAVDQLGQLAVEAGRQIVLDLADLFLGDVIVVEQPLRRRRHRAMLARRLDDGAISFGDDGGVVVEPGRQRTAALDIGRDALGRGEAGRVLLQAFDAEEFRADRSFGRLRRLAPRGAAADLRKVHGVSPLPTLARIGRARRERRSTG